MSRATYPIFRPWTNWCLLLALGGGLVCALAAWSNTQLLWHAYLLAFLLCWLVTMGGLGLLALGNLTGGSWAFAARPFYASMMKTLPMSAILFVPIGLGLEHIYPWARTGAAASLEFSPSKAAYFDASFVLARAAGYFVVWLVLAWLLGRVSRWDLAPSESSGMRRVGALSLVVLVPTVTFAAFDWIMSLEPHWYSSIYGALCTAGGVLATQALAIVGLAMVWMNAPSEAALLQGAAAGTDGEKGPADVLNDMGNLTLAFLMLWAYFAFSQFLIIWSGNLPHEITWYSRRLHNGWQFLALAVVLFNFAVPFLLLLSRERKRRPRSIARVALLLLVMYDVQMYWTVVPAFEPAELRAHVANIGAVLAVTGLWLAVVCRLADRSLQACRLAYESR